MLPVPLDQQYLVRGMLLWVLGIALFHGSQDHSRKRQVTTEFDPSFGIRPRAIKCQGNSVLLRSVPVHYGWLCLLLYTSYLEQEFPATFGLSGFSSDSLQLLLWRLQPGAKAEGKLRSSFSLRLVPGCCPLRDMMGFLLLLTYEWSPCLTNTATGFGACGRLWACPRGPLDLVGLFFWERLSSVFSSQLCFCSFQNSSSFCMDL